MLRRRAIRLSLLSLLLVWVWVTMLTPAWGEWYARMVYPSVAGVLTRLSSSFPFSVGDCFIYGSLLGLVGYWIYVGVRRRNARRSLLRSVEYLAWVYVWFYLAWGLNYFRAPFYPRSGIGYVAYEAEPFKQFLSTYTDSLNASFPPTLTTDPALMAEEVKQGYLRLDAHFGLLSPDGLSLRAKHFLLPGLMSSVGVLGYMGPFVCEYNINPRLLPVQQPFTYAHELAHVLGIANEAEANLYAYLVCTRSEVPQIRFSGYFGLLAYVLDNCYTLLPPEEFETWTKQLSPAVRQLFRDKQTYWQGQYSPTIGAAQNKLYNLFLKGNNIPTGRRNYSEVIGLLMSVEALCQ